MPLTGEKRQDICIRRIYVCPKLDCVSLIRYSQPAMRAPIVTEMLVIPVAGHDSMLLNLSGAHGPFFTRNVVILKDNSGRTGVGEVPGGEKIRQTLEDSRPFVIGQSISA